MVFFTARFTLTPLCCTAYSKVNINKQKQNKQDDILSKLYVNLSNRIQQFICLILSVIREDQSVSTSP